MPNEPLPDPLAGVYATRRMNLRSLAADHDFAKTLAKRCGFSAAHLNQLIGKVPRREITERTARRIETKLALVHGWLDMTRGS